MTPAWELLATKLTTPTDVFIYRFRNNDPINGHGDREPRYMTDLPSWMRLYGYDTDKMLGARYAADMIYRPTATISAPQLNPDLGVTSGLQCIVDKVGEK